MKSKIELESMFDNAQTMHLQEFINYYTTDTPNTGTVTGEGLHTKGEWITANKIGSGSSLRIYCTDNVQRTHIADCFSFSVGISDVEAEANANRIVNCVNNFDSLVSALKMAKNWFEYNYNKEDNGQDYFDIGMIETALNSITNK